MIYTGHLSPTQYFVKLIEKRLVNKANKVLDKLEVCMSLNPLSSEVRNLVTDLHSILGGQATVDLLGK
jgi:hypothetical protein